MSTSFVLKILDANVKSNIYNNNNNNKRSYMERRIETTFSNFQELNERHRELVPDFEENCRKTLKFAHVNMILIERILQSIEHMFLNQKINDTFVSFL